MGEPDLSGLDEPLEIPHEFEIDLHNLVVENLGLTLGAIDRSEEEFLANLPSDLDDEAANAMAREAG